MDENDDDFFTSIKGQNYWFEHLDKNTLKKYCPEYEHLIQIANTEPYRTITIRHEATSKTHVEQNSDKKEKNTKNDLLSRQEKQMFNLLISRCNKIFIAIKSDRWFA